MCLVFVFQYMTAAAAAAAPMQGTYIPQYTPVPPTAVPVEVRHTNTPWVSVGSETWWVQRRRRPATLPETHSESFLEISPLNDTH